MERQERWSTAALILVLAVFLAMTYSYADRKPHVVSTEPDNDAAGVSPAVKEVRVTFSEAMIDRSWSWSFEDRAKFPGLTGQPYYTEDRKTCVLPVRLEPNRQYVIWINTRQHQNFRTKEGVPVVPYRLTFSTGPKSDVR